MIRRRITKIQFLLLFLILRHFFQIFNFVPLFDMCETVCEIIKWVPDVETTPSLHNSLFYNFIFGNGSLSILIGP